MTSGQFAGWKIVLTYQVLQVFDDMHSDGKFFHSFMACFDSICIHYTFASIKQ